MPERKTSVRLQPTGEMADGSEVPIDLSTERWSEIRLEDGVVVRIKASVMSVVRLDNRYDQDGNPMYVFNLSPQVFFVNIPEHLRNPQKS